MPARPIAITALPTHCEALTNAFDERAKKAFVPSAPAIDAAKRFLSAAETAHQSDASQHWLESAVGRATLPFVPTGVFVGATDTGMAAYAPGAHSIGQVIQQTQTLR